MDIRIVRIAVGISGLIAVAMGAVGAHAVADAHGAEMVRQAALYHLVHTVAVLVIMEKSGRIAPWVCAAFGMGMVLFSGLIYAKYMAGVAVPSVFIPAGGICYMLGWIGVAVMGAVRR